MKKGKSVLTRRVLASLLAGVLLGSVGYVQPAEAKAVTIDTQEKYDKAGSDVKSGPNGDIIIGGSVTGNEVTIGKTDGGDVPGIGSRQQRHDQQR